MQEHQTSDVDEIPSIVHASFNETPTSNERASLLQTWDYPLPFATELGSLEVVGEFCYATLDLPLRVTVRVNEEQDIVTRHGQRIREPKAEIRPKPCIDRIGNVHVRATTTARAARGGRCGRHQFRS